MRRASALSVATAGLLLAAAVGTEVRGDAEARLRALSAKLGQGKPLMRIGLEAAHRIEIASAKAFRVVDLETGSAAWKPSFEGVLNVVAEGGPRGEVQRIFRVQVGAFSSRDAAERERQRLASATGAPGVVHHDPDRGTWRVRIGRAKQRVSLAPLVEQLRRAGVSGPWIAEEPEREYTGVTLRLVDESYDSAATGKGRLAVVPARGAKIEVNGTSYRGLIEVRVNAFGMVRPINWIELETYLLGVVPAELGPEVWPEIEALQAQAVAARTYAWRNKGQFGDEGFDLCATPRCQVYSGADAEHPLSDRAVTATRGQILTWNDQPIVALYTATCGGHTEDGGEMFPEHAEPYLKGVPCRAENDALATLRATVQGRAIEPVLDETSAEITRDWALLQVAGVLAPTSRGESLKNALSPDVLRAWTRGLARLTGLGEPSGAARPVSSLGQAAAALLADLGWDGRAEVLLSGEDLPALLRDPEAVALPEDQRRALAYLVWTEGLRPFPDGAFHVARVPSVARLLPALARVGETYEAFGLREAVVSGVGASSVRMVQGKGEIRLPLARQPWLFGLTGGKRVPARRLEIWPGDRVRFRTDPSGAIDFLELQPPVKGASDDRSAAVYSWQLRKTRRQLEAAINRRLSVGRLRDLKVVRRGVSGRVVELEVVGTNGSEVVRGFDVRRLLELREILTVIEIQRDPDGEIRAVVFAGKGWGHGVGLCQVGAYGMALRGSSYREILSHYYRGSRLKNLTP